MLHPVIRPAIRPFCQYFATIKLRHEPPYVNRDGAELNGLRLIFTPGWRITDNTYGPFCGEWAMLFDSPVKTKLAWLPSGDLQQIWEIIKAGEYVPID